jgi:hypothetical protein
LAALLSRFTLALQQSGKISTNPQRPGTQPTMPQNQSTLLIKLYLNNCFDPDFLLLFGVAWRASLVMSKGLTCCWETLITDARNFHAECGFEAF